MNTAIYQISKPQELSTMDNKKTRFTIEQKPQLDSPFLRLNDNCRTYISEFLDHITLKIKYSTKKKEFELISGTGYTTLAQIHMVPLKFHGDFYSANAPLSLSALVKPIETLRMSSLQYMLERNKETPKLVSSNLAAILKINSGLRELNLEDNLIGDNGAACLSEALKVNNSLTKLDLSLNKIGDNGATCLSEALKVNNCLTELNLRYNGIGEKAKTCLSEALKVNSSNLKIELK